MNMLELVKKLETYGFECEAGPMSMCTHWTKLVEAIEEISWAPEPRVINYVLEELKDTAEAAAKNGMSDRSYMIAIAAIEWATGRTFTGSWIPALISEPIKRGYNAE